MQKLGLNVGIFDGDIYGPSLPTMVNPENSGLFQDEFDSSMISPVMFSGMKCMSYGFAS
jgi:Mrp family chromosome partitioning ATPase